MEEERRTFHHIIYTDGSHADMTSAMFPRPINRYIITPESVQQYVHVCKRVNELHDGSMRFVIITFAKISPAVLTQLPYQLLVDNPFHGG